VTDASDLYISWEQAVDVDLEALTGDTIALVVNAHAHVFWRMGASIGHTQFQITSPGLWDVKPTGKAVNEAFEREKTLVIDMLKKVVDHL